MLPRIRLCAIVCLAGWLTSTGRAAPVDPLLPPDTEVIVTLNPRQLQDSELLKRFGLDRARAFIQSVRSVKDVLDELGFDPLADLERVTIASPGGKSQDRGLVILRGKFDVAKFRARAERAAREDGNAFRPHSVPDGLGGKQTVYEIAMPEGSDAPPIFVAIASNNVLLASPGKDYVVDTLKRVPGKAAPAFRNRDVVGLLERLDDKQTIAFAAIGSALAAGDIPDSARDLLGKLDAVGGGLLVTDEIRFEIALSAKDLDQAREIEKTVSESLNQAIALLVLVGGQKPELAPVVDFVKSLRVSRKDRVAKIRGQVGAEVFEGLFDR